MGFCSGGRHLCHRPAAHQPDPFDPARILVIFVTTGVVLTALGVYEPLVDLAGAGATVPLTGFGYALGTGAMEGAMENGWLGAFTGGISATAGGVAAAILFGYLNALLFNPKAKK